MKKPVALLLALLLALSLCACGESSGYGVKTVETLVEQDYSLAFRTDDPIIYYVVGALQELAAEGKVDELSMKWFGSTAVEFDKNANALDAVRVPEGKTLKVGVDTDSFPFAYKDANGVMWGYDVELAGYVCEKLGWELSLQQIRTDDVYVELSSGNIDVAWGGIARDEDLIETGKYTEYGPYIHNDIVIAARGGSGINKGNIKGKRLAMTVSEEAAEALETMPKLSKKLSQIIQLSGGATECFEYLYSGKCELVLADSTAMLYFNAR